MTVRRAGPGVARVSAALQELDGVQGKVGWFESATYPDGTPVAYVASIHEFGTSRTPARPFMRPAVEARGEEWIRLLGDGAKAVIVGSHTAEQVVEAVALKAAGDVGKAVQAVTAPPLSPVTVKRKGFEKPLVDTGQMIQSVTGIVEPSGV